MGKNKIDIHQEIKKELRSKERFGESKFIAKQNGTAQSGIYSYSTAKLYNRECQKFAAYVREKSPTGRYTSLQDSKQYAKEYIQENNKNAQISPYTVKMQASALAKLYGCKASDFGKTESRHRANITRSRERTVISDKTGKVILNPSTRAGHFSEKKNAEFVDFCRCTGLRRMEITALKGNQLLERNGQYFLNVVGKGGRERMLPIIGNDTQIKKIVEKCRISDKGRVWESVPAAADIHHYRSVYATTMYNTLSRERDQIPKEDRYCCRGDLKGTWYDKKAMLEVSQALGHNRISVIAEHYLR